MFKKSKTKNLRSILESPFQICWPEKSREELLPVQKTLKGLLPVARLEQSNLKTKMLEKKEAKRKRNIDMKQTNTHRSFLAPGYQSVIRGMEKKELCCAVFSSDVTPTLLLKVALTSAKSSGIPVIVIPDLKTITSSALGFATMALGFKTVVAECANNPFHKIFNIINENPTLIELPLTTKQQGSILEVNNTDSVEKYNPPKIYQESTENVYLFRKPNGKRAFVPNCKTEKLHDNTETEIQNPYDFISIKEPTQGRSSSHNLKNKSAVKDNYLSDVGDDNDDSDSDDGNKFFVDNLPDESLFKTNYVNSFNASSEGKHLTFKKKKKTNVQDLRKSGSHYSHMAVHKNNSYAEDLNKGCEKKKFKPNKFLLSNAIKFQPMSIKTITSKSNKIKAKRKKRFNVNKNK